MWDSAMDFLQMQSTRNVIENCQTAMQSKIPICVDARVQIHGGVNSRCSVFSPMEQTVVIRDRKGVRPIPFM